jgi:hypothetical protein
MMSILLYGEIKIRDSSSKNQEEKDKRNEEVTM